MVASQNARLWISPRGAVSPLHFDSTTSFLTQVCLTQTLLCVLVAHGLSRDASMDATQAHLSLALCARVYQGLLVMPMLGTRLASGLMSQLQPATPFGDDRSSCPPNDGRAAGARPQAPAVLRPGASAHAGPLPQLAHSAAAAALRSCSA